MPTPDTFLLHNPPSGDTHVLRVRSGLADSIATFSSRGGAEYAGLACVLFDPADSNLPWGRGDVLLASSSGRFGAVGRSLIRLRRQFVGRLEVYVSEVIFSDSSSSPIRSLSLDPFGALYFSEAGSRVVRRFAASRTGELTHAAWAQVPPTLPWQGDFALSPDGYLCVSSGAGSYPGRIFKISFCADPDADDNAVQTVEFKKAFEWSQADIEGFSFFDGGRVLFGSSDGSFYGAGIYAELNPRTPPGGTIQPVVPTAPTITIPPPPPPDPVETHRPTGFSGLHVTDLAVSRVAWEQYLADHTNVAEAVQWIGTDGALLPYSNWDAAPSTPDFRRLLHRFYAFRRARRPAPLTYRRQTEPDGKQRLGPETAWQRGHFLLPRDASETFLAYLAHTLWMEVARQVPWRLHDYQPDELALLVNGSLVFEPRDWTQGGGALEFQYQQRPEPFGDMFPSDPYEAFRFITGEIRPGDSFLDTNPLHRRLESVYRLLRWGRDHIRHHDPSLRQDKPYEYWGYSGEPPLESTYLRTEQDDYPDRGAKHNAWPGCISASSFFSHILRLMQIPARPFHSYLGDSIDQDHHGLDIPSEQALILHVDEVYDLWSLEAMWADPAVLAEPPSPSYQDRKQIYQTPPASETDRQAREILYDFLTASYAVRIIPHKLFEPFWSDYSAAKQLGQVDSDIGAQQAPFLWSSLKSIFKLSSGQTSSLLTDSVVQDFVAKINEVLISLEHEGSLPSGLSVLDRLDQGLTLYQERFWQWFKKDVDIP